MNVPARIIAGAACLSIVSVALAAWRAAGPAQSDSDRAPSTPRASAAELPPAAPSWLGAAERALRAPTRVRLPFAEQGELLAHEAEARAFSFAVESGQTIEINLARTSLLEEAVGNDRIYIDVWRIVHREHGAVRERLEPELTGPGALSLEALAGGEYIVRLAPEPGVNVAYGLTLELHAALPFPVNGHGITAVHSFFGDSRDAGTRRHEGVDIFARRSTPVRAVAEGRAVPRRNELGGRVVFLNTAAGLTYYYAHLERAEFAAPARVRAGDVIGYVGNTGNASSTPPHLHFGIYRWGYGAVDPMPRLRAARFADRAAVFARLGKRLGVQGSPSMAALHVLPDGGVLWSRERRRTAPPIVREAAWARPGPGIEAAWSDRRSGLTSAVPPVIPAW